MNVFESLTFIYNGLGAVIGCPAAATKQIRLHESEVPFCLDENSHVFSKTCMHVILIAASFYEGRVLKRRQA